MSKRLVKKWRAKAEDLRSAISPKQSEYCDDDSRLMCWASVFDECAKELECELAGKRYVSAKTFPANLKDR